METCRQIPGASAGEIKSVSSMGCRKWWRKIEGDSWDYLLLSDCMIPGLSESCVTWPIDWTFTLWSEFWQITMSDITHNSRLLAVKGCQNITAYESFILGRLTCKRICLGSQLSILLRNSRATPPWLLAPHPWSNHPRVPCQSARIPPSLHIFLSGVRRQLWSIYVDIWWSGWKGKLCLPLQRRIMQQPRHWHAMMEKEFFLYQLKSRVWTGIKLHPNIGIIPDIHMKSNMFISCTSFDTLQIRLKKNEDLNDLNVTKIQGSTSPHPLVGEPQTFNKMPQPRKAMVSSRREVRSPENKLGHYESIKRAGGSWKI